MAIFKCKMCGAQLDFKPGQKIVACAFCSSLQTIPDGDDEQKALLYNRANTLRMRSEFDKAIVTYQSIINTFPNESEAYWGLCLSKYGIEYVDDPRTGEKVPTCHRTLFESILDDPDYLEALKYADPIAKDLYTQEAKEIDRIQKRIIRISQKEEPYEIFICYKETDDGGSRTIDSVLAQDIYDRLTEKGYKVFFARITLENKLGQEYEPIIFAALRSAKVMLVVGTKTDHFEAVWVKNEWSRFLSFMVSDKNKYLIPCYKDIDAYDMPDEFLSLQAQDMNKIGYLQDLIRGIDKLFGRTAQPKVASEVEAAPTKKNRSGYYTRIEQAITKGDFQKADWLLDTVFAENDKDAKAYYYKIFVDARQRDLDYLSESTRDPMENQNFALAYEYADPEFKEELDFIIKSVKENKKEVLYKKGLELKNSKSYDDAITTFSSLNGYRDSEKQIEECNKLLEEQKVDNRCATIKNQFKDLYLSKIHLNKAIDSHKEKIKAYKAYGQQSIKFLNRSNVMGFVIAALLAIAFIALVIVDGISCYDHWYNYDNDYPYNFIISSIISTGVCGFLGMVCFALGSVFGIKRKEARAFYGIGLALIFAFMISAICASSKLLQIIWIPVVAFIILLVMGILNIVLFTQYSSLSRNLNSALIKKEEDIIADSLNRIDAADKEIVALQDEYFNLKGVKLVINQPNQPVKPKMSSSSVLVKRQHTRVFRVLNGVFGGIASLCSFFGCIAVFCNDVSRFGTVIGYLIFLIMLNIGFTITFFIFTRKRPKPVVGIILSSINFLFILIALIWVATIESTPYCSYSYYYCDSGFQGLSVAFIMSIIFIAVSFVMGVIGAIVESR